MRIVHSPAYATILLKRCFSLKVQARPAHGRALAVALAVFALSASYAWSQATTLHQDQVASGNFSARDLTREILPPATSAEWRAAARPAEVVPHVQHRAPHRDREAKPTHKPEKRLRPEEVVYLEDIILRLINIVRKKRGLHPLKPSRALAFLARHHSRDMCRTNAFLHESDAFPPGWRRFMERMKKVGVWDGGENIAYRTMAEDRKKWAASIVKGWVGSPPHLKNILDPAFRYSGVGIGQCGRRIVYVTQVFSGEPGRVPVPPHSHPASRLRAQINGTVDDVTKACIE